MRDKASSSDGATSFDPARIRFVLVEPQSGGNVGAAARALKNLGFDRLVLVRPACDPAGQEARMMAVEARPVLEAARVHDDLNEALSGAATVVGTSRRVGKHRRPHYRLDRFSSDLARLATEAEVAVVFGREDHGLCDADLDLCTHLVGFPASDAYPSFNLAQAVLLVAYELRLAGLDGEAPPECDPPAGQEEREAMYGHLREALLAIGFLHADTADPIMRRLRRLLGRTETTANEVQLLRGLARQITWAAGQAGPPDDSDRRTPS